ncbi:MAG: NADH-quinone oxidoreductase subunit H [Candidatus Margulisbacteria bacterium]|jgi:NADH-quinone oxidoreductase subunit H|nr:NADH-quinone oxidoreductase subunit H [Candidatus Margulisiibacteriota bacterium]
MLSLLFSYLIFPGFLFLAVVGLLATWVDRKVTARLQYRVGPPWFQPFADLAKLLGKQTIVPEGGAKSVFLGAPLVGLAGAILVGTLLWSINAQPVGRTFVGDLIVVMYLLMLPSLALIIGGSASRNPLAAIGASREMKLILAYELPFIISAATVIYRARSLQFGGIVAWQLANGPFLWSLSGLCAFLAALLVVQAKLGAVPFDLAEAEQEIAAGAIIEYSGPALAAIRLTRAILYFVLPLFLTVVWLGGIDAWFPLKYLGILTLVILIKNTNPRLRIDHALRFFWGPVTLVAVAGFILAVLGK